MYQGKGGSVWQRQAHARVVDAVEPGRDPRVHVGQLVERHVPVGGEAAEAGDDDGVDVGW